MPFRGLYRMPEGRGRQGTRVHRGVNDETLRERPASLRGRGRGENQARPPRAMPEILRPVRRGEGILVSVPTERSLEKNSDTQTHAERLKVSIFSCPSGIGAKTGAFLRVRPSAPLHTPRPWLMSFSAPPSSSSFPPSPPSLFIRRAAMAAGDRGENSFVGLRVRGRMVVEPKAINGWPISITTESGAQPAWKES